MVFSQFLFAIVAFTTFAIAAPVPLFSRQHGPKRVIYMLDWPGQFPSAAELKPFTHVNLAFLMAQGAPGDTAAAAFADLDPPARQNIINDFNANGMKLMVSAFGATDNPVSNGANPTVLAQTMATWVKTYGLHGIDVDLEDMALTADWLISFQKELRIHLPVGQYIITHAPEAGYIVPGSPYAQFNQAMGGTVDFYNLQFYNIGSSRYGQSDNVANFGVDTSSPSLQEIKNIGFDPAKLVMGFPVIPEDAMDDQHLSAEAIHQAALAATAWGWPYTGIMGWQYKPGTNIAQTWAAAALP